MNQTNQSLNQFSWFFWTDLQSVWNARVNLQSKTVQYIGNQTALAYEHVFSHWRNKAHLNRNEQALFWHSFCSVGFIYLRQAEQYELPQWIFLIMGKIPMAKYTVQWTGTQERGGGISARQTGSDAKFGASLSKKARVLKQLPWVYIVCLSLFYRISNLLMPRS